MDPKLFKKASKSELGEQTKEEEKEKKLQQPEKISQKEILPPREKEWLRKEVLKEIEVKKKPSPKRPVFLPAVPPPPPMAKSPTLIKIESILEQDLQEVYFKMEPAVQQKFKTKGEQTAAKIEKILQKTKVKAKEIFKLIVDWLKIIPGVNRFFIQQEAKIKTDKIMKIKN